MVKTNSASQSSKTSDTATPIYLWVLGVITLVIGFMNLFIKPVAGVFFILAALAILPFGYKRLEKLTHFTSKKSYRIGGFVFLFVVALVFGVTTGTLHSASQLQPSVATPAREEMNLSVVATTFSAAMGKGYEGDNSPTIAIKNLNSNEWDDCDLTLNNEYKTRMDYLGTESQLKGSDSSPDTTMDSMVIYEGQFLKSDGTRFNGDTQVPLNLEVVCRDGDWVGNVKPNLP